VRRVPSAPAAVLAELDPVGIVPLRLLGLIVAPLALLAREGDGDSDFSASHGSFGRLGRERPTASRGNAKRPRRAARSQSSLAAVSLVEEVENAAVHLGVELAGEVGAGAERRVEVRRGQRLGMRHTGTREGEEAAVVALDA
jgi:hypothetical protein